MNKVVPFLKIATGAKPRAAIFLSGSGSNAERVLEKWQDAGAEAPFEPAVIVTDAPDRSRAHAIGQRFHIPVEACDIRAFYRERGETRVSITTARGQDIRAEWTDHLRCLLETYRLNFGILAGFVPLTNLTADMPCLNVHPGDLTYLKDGRRHLVGLHTAPIERAILEGLDELRSSIIIAQPYTGKGGEMDSGPILGISEPVRLDLNGATTEELASVARNRPDQRPKGGYADRLEQVAQENQQRLKENGDWVVFPPCIFDFARQRFGQGTDGGLFYQASQQWHPIETVIYGRQRRELVFRSAGAVES